MCMPDFQYLLPRPNRICGIICDWGYLCSGNVKRNHMQKPVHDKMEPVLRELVKKQCSLTKDGQGGDIFLEGLLFSDSHSLPRLCCSGTYGKLKARKKQGWMHLPAPPQGVESDCGNWCSTNGSAICMMDGNIFHHCKVAANIFKRGDQLCSLASN